MNTVPTGNFGDFLLVNNPAKWWTPGGVFSALIRWRTSSNWSHVAILLDDGKIIEAMPSGVIIRDASVYAGVPWRVRTWRVPLSEVERADGRAFLLNALGRPYDWSIILGFLSRNPKTSANHKFFCSELGRGFAASMKRVLSDDQPDTLTPPAFFAQEEGTFQTTAWQGIKPLGWPDANA